MASNKGFLYFISFIVLCSYFAVSYANVNQNYVEQDYGIMIDAGSSGSRIYLYNWPHRVNNTLPLVEPTINQTVVSNKTNTPLSSFVNNPKAAGSSLVPLVNYVLQNLNSSKWATTPIYLKATAGMRALNITSQLEIIASVQAYLATTPFEFEPSYAQVIPGVSEGVFGWITTNYASQVLQLSDSSNTFGALDMGGASTQLTFIPQEAPKQNGYPLDLANINYSLYTYSYPLGQDVSLNILLSSLVADVATGSIVENPCYLDGYNETYQDYLLIGTANYTACVEMISEYIVVKNSMCDFCGIGDVYQPPVYGNFYAFSGFAYTFSFLGLSNTSTIADLQNATDIFCNTPWSDVIAAHNTTGPQYLKSYCFTGAYFQDILTRGYGFSASTTNVIVQSIIGTIELTWALGAMIFEASLLPFGPSLIAELGLSNLKANIKITNA